MRRSRLLLALALALLPALAARPAAAQPACQDVAGNIVVNCGFEANPLFTPMPSGYTVVGGGHAFTTGSARNGTASFEFYDRTSARSSTLAQQLTTTVGTVYQIRFYAFNDSGSDANNRLTVMFGDAMVGGMTLFSAPVTTGAYQQFTLTGVATSTLTTLAFTGYNANAGNLPGIEGGTRIDDLSVVALATAAPEPATWALFGAGLLAVGGVARRRRAQA